jgi:hypothetical protein
LWRVPDGGAKVEKKDGKMESREDGESGRLEEKAKPEASLSGLKVFF